MKNLITALFLTLSSTAVNATLIDFEGFADTGERVELAIFTPYLEEGYEFTSTHVHAAVIDSEYSTYNFNFVGNDTDWFGFSEYNTVMLTSASGALFDLSNLTLGINAFATSSSIDIAIIGNLANGNTLISNITNISTSTLVNLDWTNLLSVIFTTSDDAGIDNINVAATQVPAPGAFAIIALGLAFIGFRKKSKNL
ncbi:PEP-CTERM sorting domain-containing protein [Paraglaciecola sp. 2405UD69-4]|uniref:PEP-CTERM sorting domain-containing protein n=1 Tax=Paraglaciecola sp. 2405UD69-4 TaxID=3391836 RepID=UPI0039C95ACB